jgi:hypothetical protein
MQGDREFEVRLGCTATPVSIKKFFSVKWKMICKNVQIQDLKYLLIAYLL